MRPGSRSPVETRDKNDLGRFGLGLKTASFSQCRWMTVGTKRKGGSPALRCWNLDYVVQCDEWRLLHDAPDGAPKYLQELDEAESGTIVLWQQLDRLVGRANADDQTAQDHFYAAVDEVKRHLAMTFHDYLEPKGRLPVGRSGIQVLVNGHPLKGWDAFLTGHEATQKLPEKTLEWSGAPVKVTPYVLPHHTRLSPEEWEAAGGSRGWNAHQGFYIYRGRRLLVAGDWLGLPLGKEEHYKLARIRIDLPNDADTEWHLDVKKSNARPPAALRDGLKRLATLTRRRANEVYRHRGKAIGQPVPGAPKLNLWEQRTRRGKMFYALNEAHPLVKSVLESSTDPKAVKALLRLAQETVPVPLIAINASEHPQNQAAPFEQAASTQVLGVMRQVYRALLEDGRSPAEAQRDLAYIDAFARFPELIATIMEAADLEDVEDASTEDGDENE